MGLKQCDRSALTEPIAFVLLRTLALFLFIYPVPPLRTAIIHSGTRIFFHRAHFIAGQWNMPDTAQTHTTDVHARH